MMFFFCIYQRLVLDDTEDHQVNGSLSSLSHILLDADVLAEICCRGAVAESITIAQLAQELLARIVSLCGEPESGLKHLLKWMPYVEVC